MPYYSRLKEIEAKVLDLLEEKRALNYKELVKVFGLSVSTANRYAIEIAQKYSDHIEYDGGWLRLKKSFTLEDMPPEKRVEYLQKTIETYEKEKQQLQKKLKRWKHNHLQHIAQLLEQKRYDAALKYLEELEKESED